MRFAIVGSRHFAAPARVTEYVKSLPKGASIITGSASGVEMISVLFLNAETTTKYSGMTISSAYKIEKT